MIFLYINIINNILIWLFRLNKTNFIYINKIKVNKMKITVGKIKYSQFLEFTNLTA